MKALKNGSVSTDFADAEYSARYIANGRLCINRISSPGTAVDTYGREVGLNSINTQANPGCFNPMYAIVRENESVRQFYTTSLSADAAQAIGESLNPNLTQQNYSASADTLGVHRDRYVNQPYSKQYSAEDQRQYGDLLDVSCRGQTKGLERPRACPTLQQ